MNTLPAPPELPRDAAVLVASHPPPNARVALAMHADALLVIVLSAAGAWTKVLDGQTAGFIAISAMIVARRGVPVGFVGGGVGTLLGALGSRFVGRRRDP